MKVKIGSSEYELHLKNLDVNKKVLEEINKDSREVSEEYDTKYVFGYIDEIVGKIEVEKNSCVNARKLTFWHEVVHGIMYEIGLRELGDDEGFVEALSRQLYGFMRNNDIYKVYAFLEK